MYAPSKFKPILIECPNKIITAPTAKFAPVGNISPKIIASELKIFAIIPVASPSAKSREYESKFESQLIASSTIAKIPKIGRKNQRFPAPIVKIKIGKKIKTAFFKIGANSAAAGISDAIPNADKSKIYAAKKKFV